MTRDVRQPVAVAATGILPLVDSLSQGDGWVKKPGEPGHRYLILLSRSTCRSLRSDLSANTLSAKNIEVTYKGLSS